MAYISYLHHGRPGVGELVGTEITPLEGLTEIGATTPNGTLQQAQRSTSTKLHLADVQLRPVIPNPGKIFCVGLNYHAHITETKREQPTYPVLFPKFASSLLAHGDVIELPTESSQVDYEAEVAIVIGRAGRRIAEEDALDHIMGFTISNDVTMRDFQYKTHQWMQGKAWDQSTPLGPSLMLPHEVDLSSARITTTLNGEVLQDSDLSQLIFSFANLISTISEFTALQPGDIILSGTPGGVGYRRDPQIFLRSGDTVTISVEGLGDLTNRVQ